MTESVLKLKTIHSLREWRSRHQGRSIGFVPTMGALHEGHLSLIRQARQENDLVVASIFVNPTQFGPNEDFSSYPRQLETDARLLASAGCDVLFCPESDAVYPVGHATSVVVSGCDDDLCGKCRPGHFKGVTTVVAILFNLVGPDRAYFGSKDYQQLHVIKQMSCDLHLPVTVIGMPTIREPDGLALSSRNRYLSESDRKQALALYNGLCAARDARREGVCDADTLEQRARAVLTSAGIDNIDYVSIRDAETLKAWHSCDHDPVLLIAARVGSARLIDNMRLSLDEAR
ncbi:MAG: pantoate--beta-alanine ligase [Magnetococcales bacterium]|nr:pantoate--beta-alanine ligase [Magnetococcales bacterium]